MRSGIYKITCGSKWYFGQAQDLQRREKTHLSTLQRQCHRNPTLQNTYNKYQDFKFEILMFCPIEELNYYEQMILDVWHGEPECMNICKEVGHSTRGRKASDETKAKLSVIAKARPPISEETRAKISIASKNCSEETRKKISESSKGRPGPTNPIVIDGIWYPSKTEAAKQLGFNSRQALYYQISIGAFIVEKA